MLRPGYPIQTARLLLRPLVASDLDAVHDYRSLPAVTRYLYEPPSSRDETSQWLAKRSTETALTAEGQALCLGVEERDSGQLVGDVVLFWRSAAHQQGEVGYVFNPRYAGRGLATEASQAMLRLAFDGLGLHRVCGRCDGRNTASCRVLERLGMRREAHLVENELVKGEWTDEVVYGMLRSEWAALNP